ncbi:MAG TPA: DUF2007 domain-containing protein [Sedimenticola sp.]|nr:DUF2007 domain-containing protein [Sedimenticola sp.]
MKTVYQARDRIEAQLLKDYLAGYHIRVLVEGEYLAGAAGGLPVIPCPRIWVLEDRDHDRARELIAQFLERDTAADPWRCPGCGEWIEGQFQVCWNCGTRRHDI